MPDQNPVIDPVTGFAVPESWIELSRDPQIKDKIKSGLWVLLSNGSILRRGFTTGTTAAAACKGAILSLAYPVWAVEVMTPASIRVNLKVDAENGICSAVKDGGDHQFDVTDGITIRAEVLSFEPSEDAGRIAPDNREIAKPQVELVAGKGIGIMTGRFGLTGSNVRESNNPALMDFNGIGPRTGPGTREGKAAISRSARAQILKAINEGAVQAGLRAVVIELSVPDGLVVASKTLNASLGIRGGISILGSTGFVEPWNDHLCDDRITELRGLEKVVATTGRKGLKFSRILFPDHKAVLIGSNLDRLDFSSSQDSILCGLPALILKWAWPEVLEGTGYGTVAEMVEKEPEHPNISRGLKLAKARLPFTRIVLIDGEGRVLRDIR